MVPRPPLARLVVELIIQMRSHGRPFGRGDAVDHGVAERAVRRDLVAAQDAVLLGAQTLDGAAALVIEEVGAEFHRDAVQGFEGVGEQQQLALRVEWAALRALAIPGRTDLHAAVGGIDVHVGRHAHDLTVAIEHGEGEHRARGLKTEPPVDFLAHVVRRRNRGVPDGGELTILHGLDQPLAVLMRQRLQTGMLSAQGDGIRPGHCRSLSVVIASEANQSRLSAPHPEERGTRVSKDEGPAGGLALRDAREGRAPQGEGLPDCFAPRNDGLAHLFRKFNGKPLRGQSMAISSPLPESVMWAVFSSGPPKAMLVVTRSPVGTCSTRVPSGAITEMQPETRVATQTLPFASTASESNIW